MQKLNQYRIILASQSPRRKELIRGLDILYIDSEPFSVDESYPENIPLSEVPVYLAQKKSEAYTVKLSEQDILLTADTVVLLDNELLGKPCNRNDALNMLGKISAKRHEVRTGVCLRSNTRQMVFYDSAYVKFRALTNEEIEYYVDKYHPYDKAGAYGIQEWIGYVGIQSIEGSFYNVMGLPVQKLYMELNAFIDIK